MLHQYEKERLNNNSLMSIKIKRINIKILINKIIQNHTLCNLIKKCIEIFLLYNK